MCDSEAIIGFSVKHLLILFQRLLIMKIDEMSIHLILMICIDFMPNYLQILYFLLCQT